MIRVDSGQSVVHDVADHLGVELLGERRELLEVGEQHGGLTTPLVASVDDRQQRAQRPDGDVEHPVVDRAAQRPPAQRWPLESGPLRHGRRLPRVRVHRRLADVGLEDRTGDGLDVVRGIGTEPTVEGIGRQRHTTEDPFDVLQVTALCGRVVLYERRQISPSSSRPS